VQEKLSDPISRLAMLEKATTDEKDEHRLIHFNKPNKPPRHEDTNPFDHETS
jgi:hypothetical protein